MTDSELITVRLRAVSIFTDSDRIAYDPAEILKSSLFTSSLVGKPLDWERHFPVLCHNILRGIKRL